MKQFRDLPADEQEKLRVWGRQRHKDGLGYTEIMREVVAQGVSVGRNAVAWWCDDARRIRKNKGATEARKRRYAKDPEFRKRQHKRVAARKKARLAADPEFKERTYRANNERRRAKRAASRRVEQ